MENYKLTKTEIERMNDLEARALEGKVTYDEFYELQQLSGEYRLSQLNLNLKKRNQETMKLTSENFKMKYQEISDICMDRHLEYLDDTTGQVDRYTDDDVCDDSYRIVWGFFKDLGYTTEEIDEVADNTDY